MVLKIISSFLLLFSTHALADYQYKLIERDSNKIHVTLIDPKEYEISLSVGHNQVFGREKVGDIACRLNADIAINAGFFEIGDNQDGRPTGTLISGNQVFGLRLSEHGVFIKDGNEFKIETISPSLDIKIVDQLIQPKRFNKFAIGKDIFYFNDKWGQNTLSAFNDRSEIIIGHNLEILDILNHGGNEIPHGGYVISFPKSYDLNNIHKGQKVEFVWHPDYLVKQGNFAVMGIPVLIMNSKIRDGLSKDERHARTAVGIQKDGKLALVVVEHIYKRNFFDINLSDMKKLLNKKNVPLSELKVSDIKKIILEDLTDSNVVGFSTQELAEFMKEIGCIYAINLDGGGSSSLYISGKYINNSCGDKDEAQGQKAIRPVSDALVFKKRMKISE